MKALVATIALLCMSSSVLAHDIYSDLRDRAGNLCCGGQDCKPVEAKVLKEWIEYIVAVVVLWLLAMTAVSVFDLRSAG